MVMVVSHNLVSIRGIKFTTTVAYVCELQPYVNISEIFKNEITYHK